MQQLSFTNRPSPRYLSPGKILGGWAFGCLTVSWKRFPDRACLGPAFARPVFRLNEYSSIAATHVACTPIVGPRINLIRSSSLARSQGGTRSFVAFRQSCSGCKSFIAHLPFDSSTLRRNHELLSGMRRARRNALHTSFNFF